MIYEKLGKIQAELKAPKGQYNPFGKYNYRNCEDILEALKPLLKETGTVITLSDKVVMVGDRTYIEATATLTEYEGGQASSISNTAYAREDAAKKGMDGSQITGASSSYARKYALNGLFAIDDTKDADYDGGTQSKPTTRVKGINTDIEVEGGEPFDKCLTEQHLNIIIKACSNTSGVDNPEEFWKKRYGVKSLSEIPDAEFNFMLNGMNCDKYGNYIGKTRKH